MSYVKPFIEHFPRLAAMYRQLRDTWRGFEEPRLTPMGFRLAGHKGMQDGTFEPQETRLFQTLLERTDIVINVGANVGYYCCVALHSGRRVVAFEPVASNLNFLLKNIAANGWQRQSEVFPLALGRETGVMEIYGGGTGASLVKGWSGIPISYATLVPMSTLDFVLGNRFWGERCLVLVDIEGAERWMLEGASNFLRRIPKPIWMMEITVNEHQPHGIAINPNLWVTFETFWNAGYEAWTANDSCRMVCRQEVESMASGGTDSLGTRNFLFIEQGEGAGVSEAHRDRMCRNTLINPNSSIAT